MEQKQNEIPKIRFYGTINYRPITFCAVGLLFGILSIRLPSVLFIVAAAMCAILTLVAFCLRRRIVVLLCFFALFGMFRVCVFYPTVYNVNDNRPTVTGTVYKLLDNSVVLSAVSLNGTAVDGNMLIRNSSDHVKIDDVIRFSASLEQTTNMENCTYKFYLLSDNYTFTASSPTTFETVGHKSSVHGEFAKMHNLIDKRIGELFPTTGQTVSGILLGDSSELPDETLGSLRDTGVAHLLALSGLHVSILAGFLSFLMKRVNKYVKYAVIFAFLLVYCAVTAFPASLVRASLMTLLCMTAPLFNRRNDALTSCSIAFIAILLVNPYQMFSAGFVLSFCAVVGILFMYKPFCNMFSTVTEPWLYKPLAVSVAATSGTMPATTAYFHRMPLYGLAVNLVAIPLASVSVICAFFALILSILSSYFALPFVYITEITLRTILRMTSAVASLPFAVITTQSLSFVCGMLYFMRMLCLSPYYLTSPKARLRISLVLTVATFAAFLL